MRVLLTRAEADSARTREKLEGLGHDVIALPVIEIVGTGATWPSGVVEAALATSGHAFAVGMDGPALEVRRLIPLMLVGERTRELAVAHGFLGPATVAKNAAALAAKIEKAEVRPKRIVYLAGRDRKPDIEAAVRELGHELEVIEVYEARAIETPTWEAARAFRHRSIDGILHFSRRSAALLLEMASVQGLELRSTDHFCLSADVAAPLRDAGITDVHVAAHPSEDALLALLQEAEQETETDQA